MANFQRPSQEACRYYTSNSRGGLGFVHVLVGGAREVALWGGDPDGVPLWVNLNDFDSPACPVSCVEQLRQGGLRIFRLQSKRIGDSILEARLGGRTGPVWDSLQKVIALCSRLGINPDHLT